MQPDPHSLVCRDPRRTVHYYLCIISANQVTETILTLGVPNLSLTLSKPTVECTQRQGTVGLDVPQLSETS